MTLPSSTSKSANSGGRTVALVVIDHRLAAARFQREARPKPTVRDYRLPRTDTPSRINARIAEAHRIGLLRRRHRPTTALTLKTQPTFTSNESGLGEDATSAPPCSNVACEIGTPTSVTVVDSGTTKILDTVIGSLQDWREF
jgi:hypothetical protein